MGTTRQLEIGVKQYCIWLNLKCRVDTYRFVFQMYVPRIENQRHSTARSQFPAHSWAPFCTFLLAKKQGNDKESAPQQSNCNQNWHCWAEEQRLPPVVWGSIWVSMQKETDILAQMLILAYYNLNIPPMINTAE